MLSLKLEVLLESQRLRPRWEYPRKDGQAELNWAARCGARWLTWTKSCKNVIWKHWKHASTLRECNMFTGKRHNEHILAGRGEERPANSSTVETVASWSPQGRQTPPTRRVRVNISRASLHLCSSIWLHISDNYYRWMMLIVCCLKKFTYLAIVHIISSPLIVLVKTYRPYPTSCVRLTTCGC